ncbi:hypothetical protein SAMN05660284_02490 [Formivibrio citricus]|uniref:Uncharacterized protein n=2 Tax=Formivibrio citricus TaxID=83765 RepID=A0A1I5CU75_9NEIS|nr:hypothetical protein SAMN05660284_02490 [Formivibrio citricus]
MFMNANDAQGFMEDMAVFDAQRRAQNAQSEAGRSAARNADWEREDKIMEMTVAAVAIKQRDNIIADLRKQLAVMADCAYARSASAGAGTQALSAAVNELSRLTGRSPQEVDYHFRAIRSRAYDAEINAFLAQHPSLADPRKDASQIPAWYVPDSIV